MKTLFPKLMLGILSLFLLAGGHAARADVTIDGQTVVRLRPSGVGGTNIVSHTSNDFATNGSGINYQTDALTDKVPLIRTNAYPDDRSANPPSFFDAKVAAIQNAGAQPVLILYLPDTLTANHPHGTASYGLYCNADGTTSGSPTIGSNAVYLVQHYMAAPYHLNKLYLQVGNEPNLTIDFAVSPAYYCQLFQAVNDALVAAGQRENVVLMGPVLAGDYRWSSAGIGPTYFDYFLTHCNQIVDIVDYHSYTGSGDDSGLLNTPHKMDNFYDPSRTVTYGYQGGAADDSLTADYGVSSLLARMALIPFGRPNVGLALTEHNATSQQHLIAQGLWNLGLTHFFLYNPRGQVTTSFCFDAYGTEEGSLGHYADDKTPDFANWALYIRNNYTGPLLLSQKTTGNLNPSGNPYLLVTATKNDNFLYLEVINRNVTGPNAKGVVVSGDITDTVTLSNVALNGPATVYQMSAGVLPNSGVQQTLGSPFSYTFPAESATIFKFPIFTTPGFVLTASPAVQMIAPGAAANYSLAVTPQAGYSGSPAYSVSGLPGGASAAFGAGAVLTVYTQAGTPIGSYPLVVTATDGALVSHYAVTLNVSPPDFSVAGGGAKTLGQNGTVSFNLTVLAQGGFTGPITTTVSGLPVGVTATANPAPLDTNGTIVETIAASNTTPTGTYPVTVTCSSGSLSHSVSVPLTVVGDFGLSLSPAVQTVAAGASASYSATITPSSSFTGTVTFSVSGLPSGATATFSPTSVAVSGVSTLKVTTTGTTPAGSYTVSVKAYSGSLNHTATATLTIGSSPPPAAPASLTATAGNSQVQLAWAASVGATSYNLYRGAAAGAEGATPYKTGLTGTGYPDAGLTNGQAYFYQITAVGSGGESVRSPEASATPFNAPPTVAAAASASPSSVTGTTTSLSALGADDGGEANLTYTWAATGPAAVTFSANGTNAAKNALATFTQAGTYTFTVTLTDSQGATTTSSVSVTVSQTPTAITLFPASATVPVGGTQAFIATETDQFGAALSVQPAFVWAVASGGGSVSQTGTYTPPGAAGSAIVTASDSGLTATDSVTITAVAPTVATAASANSNPVTGTTTTLTVLGADAAGEANLTYTWSATGPAPVTFSVNGANIAKSVVATFTQAGTYQFTVTITNPSGLSTASSVTITVSQTLSSFAVSPAAATVGTGMTQTFTATGDDQFGAPLATQPTFYWSVASGGGSVTQAGVYTAPYTPGSATLFAAALGGGGTASVTIVLAAPGAPTGLAVSAGNSQASLSWTAPPDMVTSYTLYRGVSPGGEAATPVATGITGTSYTDTGLTNGQTYYYTVAAVNSAGTGAASGEAAATPFNAPPTVAAAASASPSPVTGTTTNLSVLGADDLGEANLTYTWAATGPAAVTFSANATNAAKNALATFTQAGTYTFTVTLTDSQGATTTSSVTVTVNQTVTTITVSPAAATVPVGGTQAFTAGATDQFGAAFTTPPAFTWQATGAGTVSPTGLFTAGTTPGAASVTAAVGSVLSPAASVTVTVGAASQILFLRQPANAVAGATLTPAVVLQVTDAYGNPVAGAGLTLALTSGGALGGTLTQTTGSDGTATFSNLSVAASGLYTLTATQSSAGLSAVSSAFTVSPPATTVSVTPVSGIAGQTVTLSATLTSGGAGVSGKTLTFQIDGKTVGTAGTNGSGAASLSYTLPGSLTLGSHTLTASFAGDSGGSASSGSSALSVRVNTTLTLTSATGAQGQTVTLTARLRQTVSGAYLNGATLSFSVDGKGVGTALTNSSGLAGFSYLVPVGAVPGSHSLMASFAGDSTDNPGSATGTLTVTAAKANTTLTLTNAAGTQGQTTTLTARLRRSSDGVYLSGATLSFSVDGKVVGTAVTGSSGLASLTYLVPATLTPGSHTLTAAFAGDSGDNPGSITGTLTVTAAKANTTLTLINATGTRGQTVTLTARLRQTVSGAYLNGATLSFSVDGKGVGTALTNSSGLANLAYLIPTGATAGVHSLTASFAGDSLNNASGGTGTVTFH